MPSLIPALYSFNFTPWLKIHHQEYTTAVHSYVQQLFKPLTMDPRVIHPRSPYRQMIIILLMSPMLCDILMVHSYTKKPQASFKQDMDVTRVN